MDRVTTILWDSDGVLVDTEGLYYEATRTVLRDYSLELTREQYRQLLLNDNRGAWHLIEARGVSTEEIRAARARRNDLYADLIRTRPVLIEGVRETLGQLRGRIRMAVVTSSMREHLELSHERVGLDGFFEFAVTADDVRETKPNPELYERGLERAGVSAADAIVIEDSARGLRAAVSAGIACYVIPTDWTRGSDFSGAAGVLNDVRDVPGLVAARAVAR